MAKKNSEFKSTRKMKTSIGKGKNSSYTKARQKKNGKKAYRGQGK